MKQTIFLEGNTHTGERWIRIGKRTFVFNIGDREKTDSKTSGAFRMSFQEIDREKYEQRITFLAKKIKEHTDVENLIKQALREIPLASIKRMETEFEKKKPIIRTRQHCFYVGIGKEKLWLRD